MSDCGIEQLIGKTILSVNVIDHDERVLFETDDGEFAMYHSQDCCEHVYLNEMDGDWNDLIGSEVTGASERTNSSEDDYGSETWTYYTIESPKGYVHLKWHGSSNGYYSEDVGVFRTDSNYYYN